MTFIDKLKQIERVDSLIRRKATGSPKDLSVKMGISERQVYNIINEMKEMGAPIFFCFFNQSYCYTKEDIGFIFGFVEQANSSLRGMGMNKGFRDITMNTFSQARQLHMSNPQNFSPLFNH